MRMILVWLRRSVPYIAAATWLVVSTSCSGQAAGVDQSPATPQPDNVRVATFAGGCFWCMEPPFETIEGVLSVVAGYTGGEEENPTYGKVSSGQTGHVEAVQIRYDRTKIEYRVLLDVFWRQIDPTDPGGQFADRGRQYRTAIFYHDETQRRLAERSKAELERSGRFERPIVTEIGPALPFYRAEQYHQDYDKKYPAQYKRYRRGSGRETFIERIWAAESQPIGRGKGGVVKEAYVRPTEAELKERLSPLQYRVIRENGTERPFANKYWDNKRKGIYVDVVSGEPLFSSLDKYDSGTGWPSFTRALAPDHIVERVDRSLFEVRMEVRSKRADSHLGHVFQDGPAPTGLRYCINSAALRFIPKEELDTEGYGEFLRSFEKHGRGR